MRRMVWLVAAIAGCAPVGGDGADAGPDAGEPLITLETSYSGSLRVGDGTSAPPENYPVSFAMTQAGLSVTSTMSSDSSSESVRNFFAGCDALSGTLSGTALPLNTASKCLVGGSTEYRLDSGSLVFDSTAHSTVVELNYKESAASGTPRTLTMNGTLTAD